MPTCRSKGGRCAKEIFNPKHDADNPIDFVWQGIVGGLTRIIRNQPKDQSF